MDDRFIPQRNLEQMDFASYQLFKEANSSKEPKTGRGFDNIVQKELHDYSIRDILFKHGSSENFGKILVHRDDSLKRRGRPPYTSRDLSKFRTVEKSSVFTLSLVDKNEDFSANLTDWYNNDIVGICTKKTFFIGRVDNIKINMIEEFIVDDTTSTLKFSIDNKFIYALSNNEVYIYNVNGFIMEQSVNIGNIVTTIDASKRNNYIYGDMDGTVYFHDPRLKSSDILLSKIFNNRISSISRNNDTLIGLMDNRSNIRVYDQRVLDINNPIFSKDSNQDSFTYGKGLSFCPWRNDLLLYENNINNLNYITFINPYNSNVYEILRTRDYITGIEWSSISKEFILSFLDEKDGIEIWNLSLLQNIAKYDTIDPVISISSSKDGTKLSSVSIQSLSVWNINKKIEVPISRRSIFNQHSIIR